VTQDHARIEEALAGYVLLALEGEEAEEADRLLSEHVPRCITCRNALTDLQALTGEIALAAPATAPPDLVLARVRRGVADVPVRRRRGFGLAAVAASVAALVAMAGLSVSLGGRVTRAEEQRGRALDVLHAMQQPGANPVPLQASPGTNAAGLVEVSSPGLEHMYLYGGDVPDPAPGKAYQLWLGSNESYAPIGAQFVPEDGLVLLELTVDPSVYDEVMITEEPIDAVPSAPSADGGRTWRASI
jgi:Anti-sigma-K factor rskA, C-terminal